MKQENMKKFEYKLELSQFTADTINILATWKREVEQ